MSNEFNIFGELVDLSNWFDLGAGDMFVVDSDADGVVYTKTENGGITADGMEPMDNNASRLAFGGVKVRFFGRIDE